MHGGGHGLTARPEGLSAYIAVTAAYWAFMLTDGALRMLVLLHFHTLGFTPVQLAYLFVLYEIAGMVTNLSAGWIAARFGLTATLYAGLGLQVAALLALTQLDPGWALGAAGAYGRSMTTSPDPWKRHKTQAPPSHRRLTRQAPDPDQAASAPAAPPPEARAPHTASRSARTAPRSSPPTGW